MQHEDESTNEIKTKIPSATNGSRRERIENHLNSLSTSQHKINVVTTTNKSSKIASNRTSRIPLPKKPIETFLKERQSIHEGTTLSPILNRVSAFTFPSLSCFKRRKSLVKRTHSPVTIVSLSSFIVLMLHVMCVEKSCIFFVDQPWFWTLDRVLSHVRQLMKRGKGVSEGFHSALLQFRHFSRCG